MELKKRLNIKTVLMGLYAVFFMAYIIVGLNPAEAAQSYEIFAELNIPSINLSSDVTALQLEKKKKKTPDTIVGSFSRAENKTLLIGHSSTVFQNLNKVKLGEEIDYDNHIYIAQKIETLEKSEIDMSKLLARANKDTLIIMTCAGTDLGNGDATHRLIITAEVK